MRMSYDIGLGNAMYFTGSLPELTSWGIGIPGTWTTGNIWIASFISDTTQNFTWKTRKNAGGTWEIDPNHDQSNLSPAFNGGY
jgi:alpha-amylase